MTENFGETPEDFDLDAWLSQGARPQRTVKIYRDWALMAELVKLEEQIAAADGDPDPSLDDVSAEELRAEYQVVVDKLAASALEITVQALTNEEIGDIAAGIPEVKHTFTDQNGKEQARWRPDHIAAGDAVAAEAIVSPKMTREQVTRMRQTLGDGPTLVLYETVTELRTAGKELPEVPTSPGSSGGSRE